MVEEKVLMTIAGIMRSGFFRARSIHKLGTSESKDPETAMIITNKKILLVFVPVPFGGNGIFGATSPTNWQLLSSKEIIQKRLDQMLKKMSLQEILKSAPKNYAISFEDIKKIEFSDFFRTIKFYTNRETYRYSVREKEELEGLRGILGKYFNLAV